MKGNAISLLRRGAAALSAQGDGDTSYALIELANNLRLVMRGEATVADFLAAYTGHGADPIDLDTP